MHGAGWLDGGRAAWAAGLLAALVAPAAWAFELGALRMPAAGEPPSAFVVVRGVQDPAQLMAWTASADGYRAAGLDPRHARPDLVVTPGRSASGEAGLRLTPLRASGESWDLLLFVNDASSVQVGRYRIDARAAGREVAVQSLTGAFLARSSKPAASAAMAQAAPPPAAADLHANPVRAERARAAVRAWAQAWSRRDVAAYLDAYASDYAGTPRRTGRDAWVAERTARLNARRQIEVSIDGLAITEQGDALVASFMQTWRADDASPVRSRKQLTLVQGADGRWRIIREAELP